MAKIRFTLRTRIYLSMLAIIVISFLVSGGLALYDHYEHSDADHKTTLKRTEAAVKASMEYFLNQQGGFINSDSVAYVFGDKICELSDVHSLFIALYDLRGNYSISTNSMTMDSLGIDYSIDYTVLKQLSTGDERVVEFKTINNKDLILAYWYFNDAKGKPIAITNVVYENTFEQNNDVTVFISELGQSYILLFLLASFAAYLLSTYITRSLKEVTKRLEKVEPGKQNEPIIWTNNDEIGALVRQYNDMLSELEKNVKLLAQEERESAWREMAQQVAHEIKNPLTPMKLRVQQLQRSWNDEAPNFNERLQTFSQSMTEQIDALARIANEFSTFAKMPKPNLTQVDLVSLANATFDLFKHSPKCTFTLRIYNISYPIVLADKDQTIRAFNNLLTNAIQAIPEGREGHIDVALRGTKHGIIVRIQDNGTGIPADKKQRIFIPNFTTKTTGTGLGLAMVKNIMNQSEGKVWFWSKENKGASFYLFFSRNQSV